MLVLFPCPGDGLTFAAANSSDAINRRKDQPLKAPSISSCALQRRFDRSSTPINSGMKRRQRSAEVSELWALT